MSSHSNIEIVRRVLEQGFGGGDLSVVDEHVAADFIEHQDGAEGHGPETVKGIIRGLHESFTDMRLAIDDIVEAGDTVWARVRAHAVNTKPIMGRPATGKSIEIDIIDVMRLRDGKLVEHWGVADRLAMLQQLGLLPRPDRRAA
jgi:predicted ester cyclase